MIIPSRSAAIDRLRGDAEFRSAAIATARVSRPMGDIMTHEVAVDGWLFWIYVYPDGTQQVIC